MAKIDAVEETVLEKGRLVERQTRTLTKPDPPAFPTLNSFTSVEVYTDTPSRLGDTSVGTSLSSREVWPRPPGT